MVSKSARNEVVRDLTPAQEHFLKKYILENRLSHELQQLSKPDCCQLIGPPFRSDKQHNDESIPLISFFFKNLIASFSFITNNTYEAQLSFWQDTVQPFIESFNSKAISNSEERQENITKRRQVNTKILSGLLLFYNSMLITEKDLTYLHSAHLKPSATGKLDKLQRYRDDLPLFNIGLHKFGEMRFVNNVSTNIIAVRQIVSESGSSLPSNESTVRTWNPFNRILLSSSTNPPRHHYEFIIQVVRRAEHDGDYEYKSHFISRPYNEFKNLERNLKKKFPGLMSTEIPKLPAKLKNDDGFNDNLSRKNSTETNEVAITPLNLKSADRKVKLFREKLRLALRGYLNTLIKFPEILHSDSFAMFLSDTNLIFNELSVNDEKDRRNRLEHERILLQTQYEFQSQTSKVMVQLSKDMDEFKQKLLINPDTIIELFQEIGNSPDVKHLSPLLKTFNEWCKLEVAATLYQVFLTQDNSNEWLNKCKKFHKLFPYTIVYGILRFTNPVKIVSKIIDLLLVNIPSISLPTWGGSNNALKKTSQKTGARNLLSMIFIMLLDEDLNDYKKELKILREEKLDSVYEVFVQRIENYVELSYDAIDSIREEAKANRKDLLLTILSTDKITPVLSGSDIKYFQIIQQSYESYELIHKEKDLKNSELYLNLKQYWQIQVRRKDKDLFKQLWQEPELTKLIKKFLTIFYQPLMKLFGKCDIHLVFRDFQKFMDDLINELIKLSNSEIYYLDSTEIFNKIKSLLDKHESVMWDFIHNTYIKDDEHLFYNLVKWIEKFLVLLRLKFVDESSVKLFLETDETINEELFLKQLNCRMNQTLERRKLFKQYLDKKSQSNNISHQDKINAQWDTANNELFDKIDSKEFGLSNEDLEDFNNMNTEEVLSDSNGNDEKELRQKLYDLENSTHDYGTSELDKFDESIRLQLAQLLKNIRIE